VDRAGRPVGRSVITRTLAAAVNLSINQSLAELQNQVDVKDKLTGSVFEPSKNPKSQPCLSSCQSGQTGFQPHDEGCKRRTTTQKLD
jgi:hypothetical protein